MPIFEYICHSCRTGFEKLIRDSESVTCPTCQSGDVTKQISLFAIQGASDSQSPDCATACEGFNRGSCGSGMCGCHGHE